MFVIDNGHHAFSRCLTTECHWNITILTAKNGFEYRNMTCCTITLTKSRPKHVSLKLPLVEPRTSADWSLEAVLFAIIKFFKQRFVKWYYDWRLWVCKYPWWLMNDYINYIWLCKRTVNICKLLQSVTHIVVVYKPLILHHLLFPRILFRVMNLLNPERVAELLAVLIAPKEAFPKMAKRRQSTDLYRLMRWKHCISCNPMGQKQQFAH